MRVRGVAQLVETSLSMHETLGSVPLYCINVMWWHGLRISGLGRQRQEDYQFKATLCLLQSKFVAQTSLGYTRPCLRKAKLKKKREPKTEGVGG